jgi:transglutaminase-like putative cysteine protease
MKMLQPPHAIPAARGRWRALPREARDTLFLLAVIAWVVIPHAGHLPGWCIALTAAMLAWRARLALSAAALPGRWTLGAILLLALGATVWTHGTLLGKDAGVTLLVVLVALKTLELRARRDAFVVFFLGFFLVLTNFLYSQALLVAAAMVVAVWGLLSALVLAHMPVGQPSLRQAAGLSARMCLLGAPIMVVLFLLFPRMAPLWGVPGEDMGGRTGLSQRMSLGTVAELALDDSVAMTVRFFGTAPPAESLYFRGPVLGEFDGREWRPVGPGHFLPGLARAETRVARASGLDYEVTFEPTKVAVLPLLELTPELPAEDLPSTLRPELRNDLQWRTLRPLDDRLRLRATAYPRFEHGPAAPVPGLRHYVELPPGYNPRTLAWAAELRRDPQFAQADADTLVAALLRHIRTGGYSYTLAPGLYGDAQGRHAIDEFWLDRREGFCEHFAAAFTVVLRALDVPARIVTGYQGAERNPVDGYYLVRNSFAHAWVEYWQAGRGWVRVDPTGAVAPERIGRHLNLRPAPGVLASALGNLTPGLLAELRDRWQALNTAWNQWVLNYSSGRQLDLLRQLGVRSPTWQDLVLALLGLIVAASALGAVWAWWERRHVDPWLASYRRMRLVLARVGLASDDATPPRELARRARARWGAAARPVEEALAAMEALRYAAPASANATGETTLNRSELRRLLHLLRQQAARLPHA